jgi:hypothetical protein
MDTNNSFTTYLTVRQFSEKHPAFTQGVLRYIIFNEKTNGFDRCIKRLGRKILLEEAAVFKWLNEQNQQQSTEIQS